jgi:hypothetical protein
LASAAHNAVLALSIAPNMPQLHSSLPSAVAKAAARKIALLLKYAA